jgi:alkylation response protein AidB-like acyl-CoA dehydrogenase
VQLEFTAEQEELRDSVRAVLQRECPISLVREVVEKDTGADALWSRMVELDWPGLTIREAHGGIGLGFVELAVVLEELGRVVAPGPFFATVGQFVPAIRESGSAEQQARFLGAVARGNITGAVAVDGVAGDGATADEVIVIEDGRVVVVPHDRLDVTPVEPLDRSRGLARVTIAGDVPPDRVLAHPERVGRAIEEATAALAVEMVGTCQAVFDMTLQYAKDREQFGVPIGSFQAVKHKLADMYVALQRARACAYFAVLTVAEDDQRRSVATATAKAAAGDAQRLIAQEGIQIHGGIGYTWEHDLHLYVKRAKAGDTMLGTAAAHRAAVGTHLGLASPQSR